MVDSHIEIEKKFDVSLSFVLPSLDAAMRGTATDETEVIKQEALYFDTSDLRLAHRGITLRRRSGGADQGWHLKLPVAAGERMEFQEPYTEELSVPEPLSRLVAATTRGAGLSPVARLLNTRTAHRLRDEDGQVLVEVADDTVTGQTLGETTRTSSWREVEVELVDGERDHLARLAKVLGKAGATPSAASSKLARTIGVAGPADEPDLTGRKATAGVVLLAYLHQHRDTLLSNDPAVRLDRPDAVHQMRVASRRLRSALRTFAPLFSGESHVALEEGLARLARTLGDERDAEVLLDRMRTALDALPEELVMGPIRQDVEAWMGDTYFAAKRTARDYLDSADYLDLLNQLEEFLAKPPWSELAAGTARREIRDRVNKTVAKVRRQGRAALATPAGPERELALHSVRRMAKRSRYTADVYALNDPKPAGRLSRQMEKVQEILGDRHDGTVMAAVLRDFAARTGAAGGNGFTYGLLLAREEARGVGTERDFAKALKKLRPLP
jgi:CHAD domain-containing protein